jgi:hypothetical protein
MAPWRARAYLWLGLEPVRTVSTDSTDSQYVRRSNPKALFLTQTHTAVRNTTHCHAHYHALPHDLPHTTALCCSQCRTLHTHCDTLPHCRTLPHCHIAAHCRTAPLPHTAAYFHTLPHNATLPRAAKLPKYHGILGDFRGVAGSLRILGILEDFRGF